MKETWDNKTRELLILKNRINRNTPLVLLTSLSCFLPAASLANPSEAYKEKSECIENPDFVTPKDETFKYCIKASGLVNKINADGELSEEKGQLNKTVEDKTSKGFRSTTSLIEYKIEEDELIQYKCEAKKVGSTYECDGSGERLLKGVRPDGYNLEKGLKNIENKKWNKALENLTEEIELSGNKNAYYQRAFVHYIIEDYLGSIKDADEALKADKNNIKAYNIRSLAKYELNDHKGAINDINKLTTLYEKLSEEEKEELEIEDNKEIFDKFYFRRALSKSELGNKNGAVKDFDKAIEIDSLNGQAYFQKGLENYWKDRDSACQDILKGISLGATDTSGSLIKERSDSDSFLEELFNNDQTLVDACQGISDKKIEVNKGKYEFEQLRKEAYKLVRKYIFVVPIFILIIGYLIVKYTGKDNDD
mgnify:CR=1 FL=1